MVTRHPALVEYLREVIYLPEDVRVYPHVKASDVIGCIVIGVLPMHLASLAKEVWEVPLDIPQER